MEHYTPTEINVIRALARYRYLTASQMIKAGVAKHIKMLHSKTLPALKAKKPTVVDCKDFGVLPIKGRLPLLYYLTKGGAELLSDIDRVSVEEIRYPVNGITFRDDYFHRMAYVDFCIHLEHFSNANDISIWHHGHYFDKEKMHGRLISHTLLPLSEGYIEPDGLFVLRKNESARMYAVEMHHARDVRRVVQQLLNHTVALSEGAMGRRIGMQKANAVLSVFVNKEQMEKVLMRLRDISSFEPYVRLFYFATAQDIEEHFSTAWVMYHGEQYNVFNL